MTRHKRLIVCSDGTWQASDNLENNVESNVTKMCRALQESLVNKHGNEVQQIVYYQSGVGTDVLGKLSSMTAGASGAGLDENVVEAYNFICLNYEAVVGKDGSLNEAESDEIFLFGFSRGAYTVRALAGLIDNVGILDKAVLSYFPLIYKAYKEHMASAYKAWEDSGKKDHLHDGVGKYDIPGKLEKHLRSLHSDPYKVTASHAKIKIVGVWDTVGSLGVPDAWFAPQSVRDWFRTSNQFHDVTLPDSIENAFHALALDEHRRPFSPTLWHLPHDRKHATNLIQCWFPGVHINAGGGSTDETNKEVMHLTDLGELADITFAWMVDQCQPFLDFDAKDLERATHKHSTALKSLSQRPDPCSYGQGPIKDSYEGSMAMAGSRTRAPGHYTEFNSIATTNSGKGKETDVVAHTNEYIHPCTRIRIVNRLKKLQKEDDEEKLWEEETDQQAMIGFKLRYDASLKEKDPHASGIVWERKTDALGTISVPEWQIPGLRETKETPKEYYAERALLRDELCKSELELIEHVDDRSVVELPVPKKSGWWPFS